MSELDIPKIMKAHSGGKIETKSKLLVENDQDLAVVYTPGVAKVCEEIAKNPKSVFELTIKKNTVAVFSDGSAVLGLGDLGPEAAIPVMEGKAMLFKSLAGVDAFPICVRAKTVEEIVNIAKAIEPVFGGFNLEDISAPRCFEIEERLSNELNIPVIHDDQHGTAVVTLAALYNALRVVNKEIQDIKIVVSGAGAAGIACSKLFLEAGIKSQNMIVCDRHGAIFEDREGLNPEKIKLSKITNQNKIKGDLKKVLAGSDVFLGLSGPNLLTKEDLVKMNSNSIVFGLSNPTPEFDPVEAKIVAAVVATGRSDFPNQVNNVLVFPGMFRGLLDAKINKMSTKIKLTAAKAIANLVSDSELNHEYILPKALDKRVPKAVAKAIIDLAKEL
jgi:malate dehydrogenase (oxaloacetate-decarboxylating)